ncbi:MAG: integrase [Planctomycetota bacterium]|nr:MAG: integrase [Planctomycetota bacterium]
MVARAWSASANRRYGLQRVCRVWRIARSRVYEAGRRRTAIANGTLPRPRKRGPVGACTDEVLAERIKRIIADSPWVSEGHRKVWARLRYEGVRTARRRVLKVMREHDLLAPTRMGRARGPKAHDRSITPDRPDVMWGTDMTSALTKQGSASIFFVIDHCTAQCLGIHAARVGTRFEALEPLRQAVRERFGRFVSEVATNSGLALRHDHGSQFVSHANQDELRLLGIKSSPTFVRGPQGNAAPSASPHAQGEVSVASQVRDDRRAPGGAARVKSRYNHGWLIERHGFMSPRARLQAHMTEAAA